MKSETLTLVLVNLAGIMERADQTVLPGVYKEIGPALHTDPAGLGSLTLYRSIVQCAFYPSAAYLAMHHNRAHVIALGSFLWAAATFLVAIFTTFLQVAVSRGLNGIGLAIAIPALKSLVADSTDDSNRGMAFGWLNLTGNIGAILGSLCAVLFALKTIMGIPGWRFEFHLVWIMGVVVGILVRLFADDPRFSDHENVAKAHVGHKSFSSMVKEMLNEAKSVMRIPSFQVIVAQGVSGSFPWSALSFAPMWLELIGFSHETTASINTLFMISCSLGGLFGGKMGDVLAERFPNSGRIVLSQISTSSAIPLAAVLLLALPDDPSSAVMHGLVFFIMGLFMSWNGSATNNPIFAEIIPEKSRTSIYALDKFFESILASFAPPVVGILAQHVYGYKPIPKASSNSIETDRKNASSLAKALYISVAVPMAICCLVYSFLYCTYPRDRHRSRMQSLIESEMQQLEKDNAPSNSKEPEIRVADSKYTNDDRRGEICSIDFDDNEEKSLLNHHI
ncbi:hypothetical protein V6N11_015429 [Hibiscus sabdariffa]|uniref:Major facilitator superfamily (MFS) profile domain-containing protein n=1 Tax=Hibiscus sabdariffa TaxID=183260 RepID=A0ABR2TS14_9ROSI